MTDSQPKTVNKGLEATKSVCLAVLVALAILQTSELWLSNMSRNFFDVVFSFGQPTATQVVHGEPVRGEYFVTPTVILTSAGGNRFFADHGAVPDGISSLWPVFVSAVADDTASVEPLDASVFNQRSVLYVYNFDVNPQVLGEHFGLGAYAFPAELMAIEHVLFSPSAMIANMVYVYVIGLDTQGQSVMIRYQTRTQLHSLLVSHIQQVMTSNPLDTLYYISSELFGLAFERNAFVPRWRGAGFSAYPLRVERILADANVSDIAERLSVFFPNPARVWRDRDPDGAFRLGDYHRVVVFDNDRVHYTNHGAVTGAGNLSLLQSFDIALGFLEQVNLSTHQDSALRLSGYSQVADSVSFYFDLFVNNLPVYLHNSREANGHWAAVTVTSGVVTEFNQILLDLVLMPDAPVAVDQDLIFLLDVFGLDTIPRFGYSLDRESLDEQIFVRWIRE